jgi:signal peptidase I
MFRSPGKDYLVFKRVIGCPGDQVAMQDHHLFINGKPLQYSPVDTQQFQLIAQQNNLGAIVEEESGNGPAHWMSYTPGASPFVSFDAVNVPEGYYFLMGDNRGVSEDSRDYGPVSRESIVGKVLW